MLKPFIIPKDNGLINSSSYNYNVDESGKLLDPKAPNIVAAIGTKKKH